MTITTVCETWVFSAGQVNFQQQLVQLNQTYNPQSFERNIRCNCKTHDSLLYSLGEHVNSNTEHCCVNNTNSFMFPRGNSFMATSAELYPRGNSCMTTSAKCFPRGNSFVATSAEIFPGWFASIQSVKFIKIHNLPRA